MGGKRTHHQDPLLQSVAFICILPLVHEYFAAVREVFPVRSEKERPAVLSERQAPPVEIQNAERVPFLRPGIDE